MSRRSPEKIVERLTPRRGHHNQGYGGADPGSVWVPRGSGFGGVGAPGGSAGNMLPHAGLFEREAWDQGPYFGVATTRYSRPGEGTREDICDQDPSRRLPALGG
jgi:hypothetical protein